MSQIPASSDGATGHQGSLSVVAAEISEELDARTLEVPLLPSVAAEVLSSSLEDKSTAARLAELIQQDQGLASHLLRVVNSPAFRGAAEIVALQQAIARLGMERIREIALTVSLKSTMFQPGPHDDLLASTWRHGLATGLWAREVARLAKKNVEVAYLCGLLHNVGAPLIINRASQLDSEIKQIYVRQLVDQFARDAGTILVEEWSLPAAVGLTVRFQGRFAEAKNAMDLVATVDLGAKFARIDDKEIEPDADSRVDVIAQLAQGAELQQLNLYPDDIEKLLEKSAEIAQIVGSMS